jgi:hypothetical protein
MSHTLTDSLRRRQQWSMSTISLPISEHFQFAEGQGFTILQHNLVVRGATVSHADRVITCQQTIKPVK